MNKQQEELAMRLDLKTPYKWVMDNLIPNQSSDVQERWKIMSKMVELNPEWVEEVVNNRELKLSDVLHDFKGIYSEDEHFLPRISNEKEYTFDEVWDALIEYEFATENELRLVCHINGSKIETLNDVLEVRTTYKDWSQFKSFEI